MDQKPEYKKWKPLKENQGENFQNTQEFSGKNSNSMVNNNQNWPIGSHEIKKTAEQN